MRYLSDYTDENDQEQQSMKPIEKKQENSEENKKLKPNKSNGLDMENYSWGQSLQEVTINISVPPGTKSRFLDVDIKNNSLKVGLKGGQPLIIDGEFFKAVKCYWTLEDNKEISILLTKQNKSEWWKSMFKGGPEIDIQKVEPEPSKLSDLEIDSLSAVDGLNCMEALF